jgi:hypothetical protein
MDAFPIEDLSAGEAEDSQTEGLEVAQKAKRKNAFDLKSLSHDEINELHAREVDILLYQADLISAYKDQYFGPSLATQK